MTTTSIAPAAIPLGDDYAPNLALTAQIVQEVVRAAVTQASEQIVATSHRMAQEAAEAAVKALWPYIAPLAALDPETLSGKITDEDRRELVAHAVAEARAAALSEVVVAIPDVVRVVREKSEVKFKRDSDGRIIGAVTGPAT